MPTHPTPRPCFECACGDHSWAAATQGYVVMVSVQDDYLLHARSWCAAQRNRTTYAQARIKGQAVYLHQLVERRIDVGEFDHVNHWGLDNRRGNLREANRTENSRNTRPRRTRNRTSNFKGVHWNKKDRRWVAQIANQVGRTIHLGHFQTEEDAARAYDWAARQYYGEFAFLNFAGAPK